MKKKLIIVLILLNYSLLFNQGLIAQNLNSMNLDYLVQNYPDSAEVICKNFIDNQTNSRNDSLKAEYLMALGKINKNRSNYIEATKYIFRAKEIFEHLKSLDKYYESTIILAQLYTLKGPEFFGIAFQHLDSALKYFEKSNNTQGKLFTYLAMSNFFSDNISKKTFNLDKSLNFSEKFLAISNPDINFFLHIEGLIQSSEIYYATQNKPKSISLINQVSDYLSKNPNEYLNMELNYFLAKLNFNERNYESALVYAFKVVETSTKQSNYDKLQNCYRLIAKIYEFKKDYINSIKYLKLSEEIKLNIYSIIKMSELNELETKYQSLKKENENQNLKHQNQNQNFIIVFFILLTIIMILILFLFFRRIALKQKLNTVLTEKKNQLELLNNDLVTREKELSIAYLMLEENKSQLEKYSLHLETLVEERTKELVISMSEVEKANKLKTEIIANMNHEIRTPLNFIKSSAALIKMDIEDESNPELVETIGFLDSGINRLTRTLELFTDLSSLKSGNFTPHPSVIDLKRICENYHQVYTKEIQNSNKDIEFIFDCQIDEAYIKADERNTEKIIEFILDNAVKFTNKGRILLNLSQKSNEEYQITIEDTGIGISYEYRDKIFEPFSQEDMSATRKYDGIGLSLALAYEYALVNNFKISFESEKDKGTKFIIEYKPFIIN